MSQLAIVVRKLTDDLNKIVENIDGSDDDDKMTLLFSAGVILEDIRKLIKGHPVARYDSKIKQPYLLYPDGRREY
ncbi:hypothetical protein ACQGSH_21040 [Bacillus wiedmannii]|uniref:hypothetical protein n=1 Tax=Bacillus wiedmannii TaxID=1890302 RepID=UPI001F08ABAE|nr:hypothetical protein [Bacillus wiedmannii]MCX3317223.1 hypothetical protein [Bacillus wiedmannii]